MKRQLFALTILSFATFTYAENNHQLCRFYPHWNCNIPSELVVVQQIETFINKHSVNGKGKGIVAFDWDGTLYNEHIPNPDQFSDTRSGQSLWHIWGANHLKQYPYLFPAFKADSIKQQSIEIKMHDKYLEGKMFQPVDPNKIDPLTPSGYDKFSQIATFENGMTLRQMQVGMRGYLQDISPKENAFTKILDIAQRMQDKGFVVWVISGSNPYFLANAINGSNGVNKIFGYHLFLGCDDVAGDPKFFNLRCNLAGNGAKVVRINNVYSFSGIYDDRFVKNAIPSEDRLIIDKYGKQLFLQQLAQKLQLPVIFYAGNSDGDTYAMNYTLNNSTDSMGLFVQPTQSTTFLQILKSPICNDRCVDVENPR